MGLTKRKNFSSLGRLDMARFPQHPILRNAPLSDRSLGRLDMASAATRKLKVKS